MCSKLLYSSPSLIRACHLPRNCSHVGEPAFDTKETAFTIAVTLIWGQIRGVASAGMGDLRGDPQCGPELFSQF